LFAFVVSGKVSSVLSQEVSWEAMNVETGFINLSVNFMVQCHLTSQSTVHVRALTGV